MSKVSSFLTSAMVHHGPGAIVKLRDELTRLGASKPVLVTDAGLAKTGLAIRIHDVLGVEIPTFTGVQPEPSYELVGDCVAFLQATGADLVIGLGGGSSIDVAKMSAAMVANEGEVTAYYGNGLLPKPGLPTIAVPTTAGTGSEVSPAAVFSDPYNKRKGGVRSEHLIPRAAILDPELTVSLPQHITAATGMDALTHAIECYTARAATLLGDIAAEASIALIGEHLPVAYAQGSDLDAREGQLMGSYLAGLSLSIANVGCVHALAQALGGLYHVPHGVANALFLPYVMAFNRIACREKYAAVAELLGEPTGGLSLDDASTLAVETVRDLSVSLGIPQHLRDLPVEVPHDGLDDLAEMCLATQMRIIKNNPRTMNLAECRALFEQAW